ncbi:MAG: Crp/Fnr family transcriptional regulator [Candidatus Firestonebacteria bacterium]
MADKINKLCGLPFLAGALEEHPNFLQFTKEELLAFSKYCAGKSLEKDTVLFSEGDCGTSMFIVKKGNIKILKVGFLGETALGQITPGEFVGEMAVIDNSPRMATAKASVDTELLELTSEKFEQLKKEHPAIALKIVDVLLRILSVRLRSMTSRMLKK